LEAHKPHCSLLLCNVFCFADPRTDPWLLVYSPLPVTLVFTLYLLFVALGPRLMQKWEPLRLKGLLTAYNLTLVALSIYILSLNIYTTVKQPHSLSPTLLGLPWVFNCSIDIPYMANTISPMFQPSLTHRPLEF
uniref:very-long-chain 3-oxoacyl-CoA synthase n=1 Tax=Chelydra serpentina TaxID=8475 RepID=A0A8C3SLZ4_CHESE